LPVAVELTVRRDRGREALMVTDAQVRLLRRKRMEGKTQEAAAAAAGMSERSARQWERGPLPAEARKPRHWRTREDPFADVWESKVVPLLEADKKGELQATTVLSELQATDPSKCHEGLLRTLQRRMRDWRALYGPDKEVYFPQEHPPGREAAVDFSHGTELGVTIRGELLKHLLFVFKLSFSAWTWICLAFGETFEALVGGLQGGMWELGGVPEVLRHDNLSAATHELRLSGGRSLNKRFEDVLEHYHKMRSTRINAGEAHENGVAEKGNDLVKSKLEQALLLRGSRDFDSIVEYEAFARAVIERSLNSRPRVIEALAIERQHLRPLPAAPVPNYTKHFPKVRRWSTIQVARRTYSVPSRLRGYTVEVRLYPDVLEVRYADKVIETIPRLRREGAARIDYRHIIWSLVRKPGAFARYRYREELFPTTNFRLAYDALCDWRGERADVEYVRILHLAASTMETRVEDALAQLLQHGEPFDYVAVKALAKPEAVAIPEVKIGKPDLAAYDRLLQLGGAR
jgi:transcriptional regulator with XRE-family HTH domain